MSKTLSSVIALFREISDSGVLFQGVQNHPVFMEPCAVSHEQFDTFIDSLAAYSQEDLNLFSADLSAVYSRLLDNGFFDGYIGLYFDVHRVTSYVTVVSHAKYAFDMEFARVLCPEQLVRCYTGRIDRATKLRGLACKDTRAKEKSRYFCFSSVLEELRRHAVQMKNLRRNPGIANPGRSNFGIPDAGHSLLNRRTWIDIHSLLTPLRDGLQPRHATGENCVQDTQSEVCAPASSIHLPVDSAEDLRLSGET